MTLQPTYREHAPSADLASYVACYWTARHESVWDTAGVPATNRVLPDACMDVLFDLTVGGATLVGTMTTPLVVSQAGPVDFLGIRFRPGGIGAVLSLPANEITDRALPLDDVWGARVRGLAPRLPELPGAAARIAVIEGELRRRIAEGTGGDTLMHAAAGLMERARGGVRVETLAGATGLGARQLERRFLAAVGVPPKIACRVVRFQQAVRLLHDQPSVGLSRVALETGYHDQAHFTREFRTFAGEAPGAYRRRRGLHDVSVQDA